MTPDMNQDTRNWQPLDPFGNPDEEPVRPILPPRKPIKSLYDLPLFEWAWKEDE